MIAVRQALRLRPLPFAVGMLVGVVMGLAIWIATDTFVLFPAFLGIGVVLGAVFSQASDRRS